MKLRLVSVEERGESEMLELIPELRFAEGKKRACYRHPKRDEVCVKVDLQPSSLSQKEAMVEVKAHRRVLKREQSSAILSGFLGIEETNLGTGYLFELIRNEDGSLCSTLRACREELSDSMIKSLVRDFFHTCLENDYVVGDLHPKNVLVQDQRRLVIVDGLGAVDLLPLYYSSRLLRRLKLNRKIRRLCRLLEIAYDEGNPFWISK